MSHTPLVRTADFDYSLPEKAIAQHPLPDRDASRMMVIDRATRDIHHHAFRELGRFLRAGDVLVLNDSQVIRARLRGRIEPTGGALEILLLEEVSANNWWAMLRPAKRAPAQKEIALIDHTRKPVGITATVAEINAEGHRRLVFRGRDLLATLPEIGEVPLPPYIHRSSTDAMKEDEDRYQTVYAKARGSIAAPTAGLHFTDAFLEQLRLQGVLTCAITLHVGAATFAPVKSDTLEDHVMHEERFTIGDAPASMIRGARRSGRRVIAVGTTTARALESAARLGGGEVAPGSGRTNLFLHPPCQFSVVDALLTNFHLPRSTLLMLVSAFASPGVLDGRNLILDAYAQALDAGYRFYSYGDAMLVV